MADVVIAPSVLTADLADLADSCREAVDAGLEWLHLAVMDGNFVPSLPFGPPVIRSLRAALGDGPTFDAHLMVSNAETCFQDYIDAGCDHLSVHVEAVTHLHRLLHAIRDAGAGVGIVLNPATPVEAALEVLEDVDLVLVMRVNPGFGGQSCLPNVEAMVRRLASHIKLDADDLVAQLGPVSSHPSNANTTPPTQTVGDKASRTPWGAILLALMALIGIGSWAQRSTHKPLTETELQPTAEQSQQSIQPAPADLTSGSITLISREPCWIALRRNGIVEFEGTLDTPRTVEKPEGVEIYPGRPDLVTLRRDGDEPITLGSINDLRWYPLKPER